ncbi:MAG TPA: hypothetical protein PL023_14125, partial [Thiobacillus sp.]|nr:hypothetical protein [Thiobacillus sp.]
MGWLRRFDATSVQAFRGLAGQQSKASNNNVGGAFRSSMQGPYGFIACVVHDKVNYQECCFSDSTQG